MRGQDFISVGVGKVTGKNAAMLELFIQYVLEHTGWSLNEIALYQKVDHAKGETISWIEKKPQVDSVDADDSKKYKDMYQTLIEKMNPTEYRRLVLNEWVWGED